MAEKYSITKKEEVYNLLKNKRNFEFMSEPLLRQLIDVMKVVRFREERILIKQGAENAFCYIIIRGSVSVYVDGKFLYKLRRTGDVFGEISFVTQSISTATIKAEKDLGVMVISYNFFNKLKNIELALWLARVIGEKLIRTSKIKSEGPPLSDEAQAFKTEALQTADDSTDVEEISTADDDESIVEPEVEGSEQIEPPNMEDEQADSVEYTNIEPETKSDTSNESPQIEEQASVSEDFETEPEPSTDQGSVSFESEGSDIGPASEEVIDLDLNNE